MNDWVTGRLYTTTGLSRERHVTWLPSQSGDAETKVLINAATQLPIFRRTKLFALRPIFHLPYNNGPVSSATATIDESPDRHPSHPPAVTAPRQTSDGHCFASLDRKRKAWRRKGWMDTSFLSHFPPTVYYRHGRDWWCSVYQPCGMISSAGMDMPIFAKTDLWLSCVTPALLQLCQDTSAPANDSPHRHDK